MQVQLKAAHSHMTAAYIAYKVSIPVHNPLTFFTLTFGTILSSTQCDFTLSCSRVQHYLNPTQS